MPEAAASVDASSWVGWLSAASPVVQTVALVVAGLIALAIVWRAPSVADAVARIRGKGETERERAQNEEIAQLTKQVSALEEQVRLMQHREDERRRMLEAIIERAQCLTPDCRFSEMVDVLKAILADDMWVNNAGHA
jgi:cell division protein FtsB